MSRYEEEALRGRVWALVVVLSVCLFLILPWAVGVAAILTHVHVTWQ